MSTRSFSKRDKKEPLGCITIFYISNAPGVADFLLDFACFARFTSGANSSSWSCLLEDEVEEEESLDGSESICVVINC